MKLYEKPQNAHFFLFKAKLSLLSVYHHDILKKQFFSFSELLPPEVLKNVPQFSYLEAYLIQLNRDNALLVSQSPRGTTLTSGGEMHHSRCVVNHANTLISSSEDPEMIGSNIFNPIEDFRKPLVTTFLPVKRILNNTYAFLREARLELFSRGKNLARFHFRSPSSQHKVGSEKPGDCKDRFPHSAGAFFLLLLRLLFQDLCLMNCFL
ncbi:hypothetical protein DNTS_024418 [Danionella cerebrum]|uniref:Uncharacterized protein n=1 Tax=Danionella cerebrum TaxID=2873325 RepID=A0A553PIU1_9TELE|nr:hypothetical protein DNTS_024418 [Danionella translucida]